MNQSCVYILSHLSFPPTLPVSPISVITSERQAEFLELDGSFPLALFTHGRVHICQCHCLSSSPHLLPRCVYKSILYGHTVYFHIFFFKLASLYGTPQLGSELQRWVGCILCITLTGASDI